jgi:hypothetical protein
MNYTISDNNLDDISFIIFSEYLLGVILFVTCLFYLLKTTHKKYRLINILDVNAYKD